MGKHQVSKEADDACHSNGRPPKPTEIVRRVRPGLWVLDLWVCGSVGLRIFGSVHSGCMGSGSVGSGSVGIGSVGFESVGFESVGFESVGFKSVGSG